MCIISMVLSYIFLLKDTRQPTYFHIYISAAFLTGACGYIYFYMALKVLSVPLSKPAEY